MCGRRGGTYGGRDRGHRHGKRRQRLHETKCVLWREGWRTFSAAVKGGTRPICRAPSRLTAGDDHSVATTQTARRHRGRVQPDEKRRSALACTQYAREEAVAGGAIRAGGRWRRLRWSNVQLGAISEPCCLHRFAAVCLDGENTHPYTRVRSEPDGHAAPSGEHLELAEHASLELSRASAQQLPAGKTHEQAVLWEEAHFGGERGGQLEHLVAAHAASPAEPRVRALAPPQLQHDRNAVHQRRAAHKAGRQAGEA
eukprot:scaffold293477_cov28-Tisochrysis_lutea.AAC.4